VLDIWLPALSGLGFQTQLADATIHIPIVMLTGHGDIPMTARAMKAGAVDFLTKPFGDQEMLDPVTKAIERDRKRRESERAVSELRRLFETVTVRDARSWRASLLGF
jgi:FixJ family two-component response regulator